MPLAMVCGWEVRGSVPLATSVRLGRTYVFCNLSTGGGVGPRVTGRGGPGSLRSGPCAPTGHRGRSQTPSPPPPTREWFSLCEHTAGATLNPSGGVVCVLSHNMLQFHVHLSQGRFLTQQLP